MKSAGGVRGIVGLVVLVLIGACGMRPPPPAPPRQTKIELSISRHTLKNGLRVVFVRDPRAPEVQVTMRYQVGAVDDPAGREGTAHLVEHLMFEQILGSQSLFARLESFATYHNATTTLDATTYVARAHASHLNELLSIEAVRVGFRCTSISDSVFERERAVVVNEVRQRGGEALHMVRAGLYPAGHPYGRKIGGDEAVVGAITRDQACAFADAHYAPANAVLVVSGNITAEELSASLERFLARIPARGVAPPVAVPAVAPVKRRAEITWPIDMRAVIIAWPLPADPELRARLRAIAPTAVVAVDAAVKGPVFPVDLGDVRAPMLGMVIGLIGDDTADKVLGNVETALGLVAPIFQARGARWRSLSELVFYSTQQSAIYQLFAALESGGGRDEQLAIQVLAGRNPTADLRAEMAGLRNMTRGMAAEAAREHLRFDRASVLVLNSAATGTATKPVEVALAPPIHDVGIRRETADPADAARPLTGVAAPPRVDDMKTRRLANGLTVVLLPLTSVPTVDVRMIFASGTADEDPGERGIASVAAHGLDWDLRHINDVELMAAAGGSKHASIGFDQTTFTTRGLDMHLDYLLAGLRRLTRDGVYSGESFASAVRRQAKQPDDERDALNDAWRTALYGADHPYLRAGVARHTNPALTLAQAEAFRDAHYTPANATLVIAGRFDAALAERWIDHLFADWKGGSPPQSGTRARSQPASIAIDDPGLQVRLAIALPATAGGRAQQLVAAAMLNELAGDVRYQLGASYGLDAELAESRLAAHHILVGAIDASRTVEAVELLRTRIEQLRAEPEAAARAFVSARRRVLVQLAGMSGSATSLAQRVQLDLALARPPLSDLQTIAAVQALTIAGMTGALADLELSRAAILLRGPAAELDRAFAVLGRTPTRFAAKPSNAAAAPGTRRFVDRAGANSYYVDGPRRYIEYTDALTLQGPPTRLTVAFSAGYAVGRAATRDITGMTLSGSVGYRLDSVTAIGLHASIGQLGGTYETGVRTPPADIEIHPITFGAFIQGRAYSRLWGGLAAGLHIDGLTDREVSSWKPGFALALEAGVDIMRLRRHGIGGYVRIDSAPISDSSYAAFTLGVAYRR